MKRHSLSTRIWHWVNFAAIAILFMSGLNISNAHPRLYWGNWGFMPQGAWLDLPRFPGWATIPGYYDLALARSWHILFAWVFALGLLAIWVAMLVNRHFRRDIVTAPREWRWRNIRHDIAQHLRLRFHSAEGKYNFLQKLAYGLVFGVLLPLMVITGMGISPGIEPRMGWLIEIAGGRQTMRSIHFVTAWSIFGFFVLHVLLVLLSGAWMQLKGMIFGGRADRGERAHG